MIRTVTAALLAALAGIICAGQGSSQLPFMPKKGVKEFSGQMIARPLQMNELLAKGMPYHIALALQADARFRASKLAIDYVPETDEYIVRVPNDSNEYLVRREMMAGGSFQYVTPDWKVFPAVIPNDPLYAQQWHHPIMQSNLGWDLFQGDGSTIVALCDTGVRLDHVDLKDGLVPGYNAVDQKAQQDGGQVNDINGHGSHTAGCAAAQGNNGKGVSGMGWNLKIMPVRVSNDPSGDSQISWLTRGARWAVDHGARIISTSYSGVDDPAVQTTGAYIKSKNGLYFWAAGNDGIVLTSDHPDVTVVAATDENDLKAYFSNFGPGIDVAAPGTNIMSTYNASANSYTTLSGTSMATPLAAGLGAMITGSNPALTSQDVENILYGSCDDLGVPGEDDVFGHGRINLNLALRKSYNEYPFLHNSFSMIRGKVFSGSDTELDKSDDQDLELGPSPTDLGTGEIIVIEYDFKTTLLATSAMVLTHESHGTTSGMSQKLDIWNNETSAWDRLDTRNVFGVDVTVTSTIPSAMKYVGANGLIRVRALSNTLPAGISALPKLYVDLVSVKTTP